MAACVQCRLLENNIGGKCIASYFIALNENGETRRTIKQSQIVHICLLHSPGNPLDSERPTPISGGLGTSAGSTEARRATADLDHTVSVPGDKRGDAPGHCEAYCWPPTSQIASHEGHQLHPDMRVFPAGSGGMFLATLLARPH